MTSKVQVMNLNQNNNINNRKATRAKWECIPSVALSQIYTYLSLEDRINASATCRHWRQCVFQKRFFQNFRFRIDIDREGQLIFFRHRLCTLVRELIIVFDFLNVFHIEKIRRLLYKVARCDNIQALRFETHNVGLIPAGDFHDESLINIEQCFVEPLKAFLNRKKLPCKLLDLGAIEALTYYGLEFLKALGKPQDLLQLTLASIKYDPSHYPIFAMDTSLLQKCASLQVLSLDYDTLNDELLHTIQILPLRKFLIVVHGLDRQHPGVSENAWSNFAAHFNNLELILTLVYAYEAIEVLQVRILRRNMPITHLRILFCDFMNPEALDWMSVHNSDTLRSIHYIDSAYKDSSKDFRDMFIRSGQDPFVMMAWRCKNLEEIIVHGYVMDPHNLVGIARLRGRKLQRLDVSMIDCTTEVGRDSFNEEICTLLGQQWSPLNVDELHPSLGYTPVLDDVRDEYVFDLLRSDLSQ